MEEKKKSREKKRTDRDVKGEMRETKKKATAKHKKNFKNTSQYTCMHTTYICWG